MSQVWQSCLSPFASLVPHELEEAEALLPVLARILPSSRPVGVMMYKRACWPLPEKSHLNPLGINAI